MRFAARHEYRKPWFELYILIIAAKSHESCALQDEICLFIVMAVEREFFSRIHKADRNAHML